LGEEWKRGVNHPSLGGSGAGSPAPILGSGVNYWSFGSVFDVDTYAMFWLNINKVIAKQ